MTRTRNSQTAPVHDGASHGVSTYPMEDAPRDGSLIEVHYDDGKVRSAIYRITRRRNATERRWEQVQYWSTPNPPYETVAVDGARWRRPDGFARREVIDGAP